MDSKKISLLTLRITPMAIQKLQKSTRRHCETT